MLLDVGEEVEMGDVDMGELGEVVGFNLAGEVWEVIVIVMR